MAHVEGSGTAVAPWGSPPGMPGVPGFRIGSTGLVGGPLAPPPGGSGDPPLPGCMTAASKMGGGVMMTGAGGEGACHK